MINTSNEYKQLIRQNRNFNVKLTVVQADNTTLEIPKTKLRSFAYDGATSTSNSFDIGGAITGELDFTLDNISGEFTEEQFYEAGVWAYVGLELSATTEWLLIGIYDVVDASTTGNVISVQAFDAMNKFCKDYSESTLAYPATLFQIVQDACAHCGVALGSSSFDYGTNIVQARPDDGSMTFKDILSYVGQKSGHYLTVRNDALYADWYDMSALNILNGGDNDFTGTDIVDGNGTTDIIDGNVTSDYFHIYAISGSPNIAIQDITITGIKVTAKGDSTTEGESYLYGEEGYVLEIADNPLILPGEAQAVATHLGQKIVGLTFRPFSVSAKSDPSIQAGDVGFVTNRKQQSFASIMTNIAFAYGDYESFGCGAKSKEKKAAKSYSEATKALQEAKNDMSRKLNTYDIAKQAFNDLVFHSFGIYRTYVTDENGTTIEYAHDQQTLEESQNIWRQSADVFSVSNDGGETWHGMSADGNILANVLNAIGVNAEWIRVLTSFTVGDNFVVDSTGHTVLKDVDVLGGLINMPGTSQDASLIRLSYNNWESRVRPYGFYVVYNNNGIPLACDGSGLWVSDNNGAGKATVTQDGIWTASGTSSVFQGNLQVNGSKNRIVNTKNYGQVLLSAYETPRPTFADSGHGVIGEDGLCYIDLDLIFIETIDTTHDYRYFLTRYGQGDIWIDKDLSNKYCFVIRGTPGLEFDWKIEAIQRDYNFYNLEKFEDCRNEEKEIDYDLEFDNYLAEYEKELAI